MRIFILGDSHTYGGYGRELQRLLQADGHQVTRIATAGAAALHYLDDKKFRKLKQDKTAVTVGGDHHPAFRKKWDLIVVTLGTNDLSINGSASKSGAEIIKLIDSLNGTKKVYVGNPYFHEKQAKRYKLNLNKGSEQLWQILSKRYGGNAIDPRDATRKWAPEGDIHLPREYGGNQWAAYVRSKLAPIMASALPAQTQPQEDVALVSSGGTAVVPPQQPEQEAHDWSGGSIGFWQGRSNMELIQFMLGVGLIAGAGYLIYEKTTEGSARGAF
jgi:hypothetical protein